MKTIYVAITAYNEPYLKTTIENCLDMAKYPDRVHFGICSHYNDGNQPNLDMKNIKSMDVYHNSMMGVGQGRMNALAFYDNEDYILQLDSHMFFQRNWDEIIIDFYERIKSENGKSVITTYVPWWSPNEDGSINFYDPDDTHTFSGQMSYNKEYFNEQYPKFEIKRSGFRYSDYEQHFGFSAHFFFAEPQFLEEIMPDPLLTFGGEEQTTAMRLSTRGYKIFAIGQPVVWHRNKGHGVLYENDRLKLGGQGNQNSFALFNRKNHRSLIRAKKILTGEILGYWGAPTLKALQKYELDANIDFKEFYSNVEGL